MPGKMLVERALGDFVVFLRRVACQPCIQCKLSTPSWTRLLLKVVSVDSSGDYSLLFTEVKVKIFKVIEVNHVVYVTVLGFIPNQKHVHVTAIIDNVLRSRLLIFEV